MNDLEKRIQEIKERKEEYKEEITKLEIRDKEIIGEKKVYDENLLKLEVLSNFRFKGKQVSLLKKIIFHKYLSKIVFGISILSIFGSIYFGVEIANILYNSSLISSSLINRIISLVISILFIIVTDIGLNKNDTKHNMYCDAYYLNEEFFDDEVYDLDRILEFSNQYKELRENIILEKEHNSEKINDYMGYIKHLELILQQIAIYKDSLDEIMNRLIIINMPTELKEKISKPLVKVKK